MSKITTTDVIVDQGQVEAPVGGATGRGIQNAIAADRQAVRELQSPKHQTEVWSLFLVLLDLSAAFDHHIL